MEQAPKATLPLSDAMQSPAHSWKVGQFDCGRLPGWKMGGSGRIFRAWRQLSDAIAAPSINALKQRYWYRKRVTRSARSAGPRWSRGGKAPTFPHSSLSNVQTESPHETDPKALGSPTEAASKESIMGKRSAIATTEAAALTVSKLNQQIAFARHQSWPMVKPVLLAALICAAPVSLVSAQDTKVSVDMLGIGGMSCAHWRSTQEHLLEGTVWIYGFWTGLNYVAAASDQTQAKIDVAAVVAKVEKTCAQQTSQTLASAVWTTYLGSKR
jgi:hypothetical protein